MFLIADAKLSNPSRVHAPLSLDLSMDVSNVLDLVETLATSVTWSVIAATTIPVTSHAYVLESSLNR